MSKDQMHKPPTIKSST